MLTIGILAIIILSFIFLGKINSELSWISNALMDTKEYKRIKEQAQFYDFIQWAIGEGLIRKGMTKEEIMNAIDNYIKEDTLAFPTLKKDYEWLEFRKNLWFVRKEDTYKIIITGYGKDIPTPKLTLAIKNCRLVGWKGLGIEAEAKAKSGLTKELPHDKELLNLLNNQKYAEAMELVIKMGESNVWNKEDTIARGKLCAEGYGVSLYGSAVKFAEAKEYDRAIETSKALYSFILKFPEFFGFDNHTLSTIQTEMHARIGKSPLLSMGKVQEIKKQILGKVEELLQNKRTVGNIHMLLDALIMTEFWKSQRNGIKSGNI